MRWACGLASALLLLGCSGALADGDGRAFGDDLGRFHVKANLAKSTCGPHAMDTPPRWEFDVFLSRMAPALYWNTGPDAVEGSLESDGKTFAFSSETVVNAASGAAGSVCTIVRDDVSAGALDSARTARAFTGTLKYDFTPQGSGDCSALLLAGAFAALPCAMTYRMAGAWISAR